MSSPVQSGGTGRGPASRARRRLFTSREVTLKERGKGKRKEEEVEMQERTASLEISGTRSRIQQPQVLLLPELRGPDASKL